MLCSEEQLLKFAKPDCLVHLDSLEGTSVFVRLKHSELKEDKGSPV